MRLQRVGKESVPHRFGGSLREPPARWPASPCQAGPEIAVGDLDVTASVDAATEAVASVILVSPAAPAQELGVPAPSRR